MAFQQGSDVVPPLVSSLRQMVGSAINVNSIVKFISPQARLIFVENLIRQDQELLRAHAQEWRESHSAKVISIVSRVRGSGMSIQNFIPGIRDCIPKGDLKSAIEGLDAIIADMKGLSDHSGSVNISCQSFVNMVRDDQARFKIVAIVLNEQLSGDKGQLKCLENLEAAIAEEMKTAKGEKLNELIGKRAKVQQDISRLKSDMEVMFALLPKVADLGTNTTALVDLIEVAGKNFSSQSDYFSNIKLMLQVNDEDEALRRLNSALTDWKIITQEAAKLENDYAQS